MRGGMHHLTRPRSVHAAGKIDEGEDRRAEPPLGASSHDHLLLAIENLRAGWTKVSCASPLLSVSKLAENRGPRSASALVEGAS